MQGGHRGAGCSLELVGLLAGVAGWLQAGVAGWGCRLGLQAGAARSTRKPTRVVLTMGVLTVALLTVWLYWLGLEYVVGFRVVESEYPK